jgi:acetyl-CoA carboxylase carboxyl transferase subunit beta
LEQRQKPKFVGRVFDEEDMKWFWKAKSGIDPPSKKDLPAELWIKCTQCKEILYKKELMKNCAVCMHCKFHFPIEAREYIRLLVDADTFEETDADMETNDPLKFVDRKKYKDRIAEAQKKTSLKSAVITGTGCINGIRTSLGIMDFRFNGGSMGTVEGEKLARVFKKSIELKIPALVISKSGGARMQEGTLSLMQMAKTSAFISQMEKARLPYISLLTNPTTGGVTASFAMLGDINMAEPGALIGFAGLRVIQETIRQSLPSNFQRAEFLLEKGFLDLIVHRKNLKEKIHLLFSLLSKNQT